MTTATIPATLAEITSDWLTYALRLAGCLDAARVVSVEQQIIGEGSGFLGRLARLRLRYGGPADGAPRTLIVKLPTEYAEARALANALGVYEREVRFYQELAAAAPIGTPRCYAAQFYPATGGFVLLLEDLTQARLGDQLAGCTLAEALMVVEQMGRFHAAFWESPHLADLAWIPTINNPAVKAIGPQLLAGLPMMMERYGELVPEAVRASCARYGQTIDELVERLDLPPRTIVHGDWRLDNMFFSADPERPLIMIDWQLGWRTIGTHDLGYFCWMSLEPELRRACEVELVQTYHRALVEGGVRGFSLDDAREGYRRGLLSAHVLPIAVLTLDTANQRGEQLFRAMIRRASAAIVDHRLWELLS